MLGAQRRDLDLMAVASPAAIAQLLFVAMAFLCLTFAFVGSDFSVLTVALNSHSDTPLVYKISGVWGNHEGSMLLWVLILALFGASVALFGGNLPPALRARVLAVQGMIGSGFLAFILFTSNPFLRLDPAPADGNGLNPLLAWKRGRMKGPLVQMIGLLAVTIVVMLAVIWLVQERRHLGFVGLGLAAWLSVATLRAFGQRLALRRGSAVDVLRRLVTLPRAVYGMCRRMAAWPSPLPASPQ
jgi:cytochrome c-type biogenesis protein CcmF